MDIDFLIQDTFSLVRPQWKLAADLQEAASLFGEAVVQNYHLQDGEKSAEQEDDIESISSKEGPADYGLEVPDADEEQSSSEADVSLEWYFGIWVDLMVIQASGTNAEQDADSESEEEEHIFVARQEERDPETEAEFDRAFEKMLTESLESRRFERKAMFDVPLPIRKSGRDVTTPDNNLGDGYTSNTMAFSLMTKRGNKQQVRPYLDRYCATIADTVHLDSYYWIAIRF
jgi:regulator of nonsense transcripts 2